MNAVVDRVVQYPHRYQLKNVNTGEVLGTFDLEPITGTISVVGTKIDKELFDSIANDISARLVSNGGDAKDNVITYSMASNRSNIVSGEKLSVSFGKIAKYFNDLKAVAFSGNKKDIDLGNVDNTSDANKPVSNATQQALNLKANASDVYSKTETDGLLNNKANTNDVYSKTKTDELLNNKANKSDVYTKTETDGLLNDKANANNVYTKSETDGLLNDKANASDVYTKSETDAGLNKSLYNLGYYDTITANSDGTYTIIRQTGYVDLGTLDFSYYAGVFYCLLPTKASSGSETNWLNSKYGNAPRGADISIAQDKTMQITQSGEYISIKDTTYTDANTFITAMQGVLLQYKLATSYTEKVEKNHYATYNQNFILDHNKSEAERSANLWDLEQTLNCQNASNIAYEYLQLQAFNDETYVSNFGEFTWNSNSYITFTKTSNYNKIRILRNGDKSYIIIKEIDCATLGLTNNNTYTLSLFNNRANMNDSFTISNIMLNEGSVALPYQQYEGKVVHEKELESITPGIYKKVATGQSSYSLAYGKTYKIKMNSDTTDSDAGNYLYVNDTTIKVYGTFDIMHFSRQYTASSGGGAISIPLYEYNYYIGGIKYTANSATTIYGYTNSFKTTTMTLKSYLGTFDVYELL